MPLICDSNAIATATATVNRNEATIAIFPRLSDMKTAPAPQPIYIHQPCSENYDAMQSSEDGKFCSLCQHSVTDFIDWDQDEIVKYLQAQSGRVCGRFRNDQLGPRRKTLNVLKFLRAAAVGFIALWYSRGELKAQGTQHKVEPKPEVVSDSVVLVVKGGVTCKGKQVSRGNVVAINADGDTIAESRINGGRFELHVPTTHPNETFTIICSARGYHTFQLKNYVSTAGNVIAIEMRKTWKQKRRDKHPHVVMVGCPSF